jgi:hypothetical protein
MVAEVGQLDGKIKNKDVYLQLHLIYQNHYDIIQM